MKFSIAIGGYKRIPGARGLEDFAQALANVLRKLGHEIGPGGRLILFNANAVNSKEIPEDAIIYNSEQLAADQRDQPWGLVHLETARRRIVWDYAACNVEWLKANGVERAVLCPVGYDDSMHKIRLLPHDQEGIDVLFYGALNERRKAILDALDDAGMRTTRLLGVFGADRDRAIARAKVVLNLHFYEQPVFEIFRVSHLLANCRCVVSEGGGCDPTLEDLAARTTKLVPAGEIVEACRELVTGPFVMRKLAAKRGYDAFKETSLVENVRKALEASQ